MRLPLDNRIYASYAQPSRACKNATLQRMGSQANPIKVEDEETTLPPPKTRANKAAIKNPRRRVSKAPKVEETFVTLGELSGGNITLPPPKAKAKPKKGIKKPRVRASNVPKIEEPVVTLDESSDEEPLVVSAVKVKAEVVETSLNVVAADGSALAGKKRRGRPPADGKVTKKRRVVKKEIIESQVPQPSEPDVMDVDTASPGVVKAPKRKEKVVKAMKTGKSKVSQDTDYPTLIGEKKRRKTRASQNTEPARLTPINVDELPTMQTVARPTEISIASKAVTFDLTASEEAAAVSGDAHSSITIKTENAPSDLTTESTGKRRRGRQPKDNNAEPKTKRRKVAEKQTDVTAGSSKARKGGRTARSKDEKVKEMTVWSIVPCSSSDSTFSAANVPDTLPDKPTTILHPRIWSADLKSLKPVLPELWGADPSKAPKKDARIGPQNGIASIGSLENPVVICVCEEGRCADGIDIGVPEVTEGDGGWELDVVLTRNFVSTSALADGTSPATFSARPPHPLSQSTTAAHLGLEPSGPATISTSAERTTVTLSPTLKLRLAAGYTPSPVPTPSTFSKPVEKKNSGIGRSALQLSPPHVLDTAIPLPMDTGIDLDRPAPKPAPAPAPDVDSMYYNHHSPRPSVHLDSAAGIRSSVPLPILSIRDAVPTLQPGLAPVANSNSITIGYEQRRLLKQREAVPIPVPKLGDAFRRTPPRPKIGAGEQSGNQSSPSSSSENEIERSRTMNTPAKFSRRKSWPMKVVKEEQEDDFEGIKGWTELYGGTSEDVVPTETSSKIDEPVQKECSMSVQPPEAATPSTSATSATQDAASSSTVPDQPDIPVSASALSCSADVSLLNSNPHSSLQSSTQSQPNMPATLPIEIESLIDAYIRGAPFTLVLSRARAQALLSKWSVSQHLEIDEEVGITWMGQWRIIGFTEECLPYVPPPVPDKRRKAVEEPAVMEKGAVRWRFRVVWIKGGDQFLVDDQAVGAGYEVDVGRPWWDVPLPEPVKSEGEDEAVDMDLDSDIGELSYPDPDPPSISVLNMDKGKTKERAPADVPALRREALYPTSTTYKMKREASANYRVLLDGSVDEDIAFDGPWAYSAIPLRLIAPSVAQATGFEGDDEGTTNPAEDGFGGRGWFCARCGKLNARLVLRERTCTSRECSDQNRSHHTNALPLAKHRTKAEDPLFALPLANEVFDSRGVFTSGFVCTSKGKAKAATENDEPSKTKYMIYQPVTEALRAMPEKKIEGWCLISGGITLPAEVSPEDTFEMPGGGDWRVVHVQTRNIRSAQSEADRLLKAVQEVNMVRGDAFSEVFLSAAFHFSRSDGHDVDTIIPDSVQVIRDHILLRSRVSGTIEMLDIKAYLAVGKRMPKKMGSLSAKDAPVVLMNLGNTIDIFVGVEGWISPRLDDHAVPTPDTKTEPVENGPFIMQGRSRELPTVYANYEASAPPDQSVVSDSTEKIAQAQPDFFEEGARNIVMSETVSGPSSGYSGQHLQSDPRASFEETGPITVSNQGRELDPEPAVQSSDGQVNVSSIAPQTTTSLNLDALIPMTEDLDTKLEIEPKNDEVSSATGKDIFRTAAGIQERAPAPAAPKKNRPPPGLVKCVLYHGDILLLQGATFEWYTQWHSEGTSIMVTAYCNP